MPPAGPTQVLLIQKHSVTVGRRQPPLQSVRLCFCLVFEFWFEAGHCTLQTLLAEWELFRASKALHSVLPGSSVEQACEEGGCGRPLLALWSPPHLLSGDITRRCQKNMNLKRKLLHLFPRRHFWSPSSKPFFFSTLYFNSSVIVFLSSLGTSRLWRQISKWNPRPVTS